MLTILGAAWCEDTRRTRRLLRRLGVDHAYRDVDDDLEAMEQATTLTRGVRRTPVVRLDGAVLVEPSNDTLTTALVEHGVLTKEVVTERLLIQNVGDLERCVRVSAGLLLLALKRPSPTPLQTPMTLAATTLLLTGITGWCPVFHASHITSMNGPGDRPDEAEREGWLRVLGDEPSAPALKPPRPMKN